MKSRPCHRHLNRAVVVWLILWIVAVPLVHVHLAGIDDDPRPSLPRHAGIAHTVVSADLPNEFLPPSSPGATREAGLRAPTIINEGELALSMLESSDDRKQGKDQHGVAVGSPSERWPALPPSLDHPLGNAEPPTARDVSATALPRAPPAVPF